MAEEFDAARVQGLFLSTQAAEAREAQDIDRFNEEAKDVLGPSAYQLFQLYERTASVRPVA